ncbi:MAG TPA: methionyl-tRNA formyltransferase [Verrucomicrobiae bacterium]|nr:methionyl-tRNA formyltransferase [Verrucomicrobiae bacterium]
MAELRLVFMGTPELAAVCLDGLLRAPGLHVTGVVTQPDRPKGRDLKLTPPPVKELALRHGLPVLQPEKARDPGFIDQLAAWRPGLIAVAAFGQILPQRILDLPRFGCLNVHTSLLPKYRGAAPIQWAILNGDAETGVTIMQMEAGLDTGPILSSERTPIAASDNAQTLHDRLARLGAALLVNTIPEFVAGNLSPRPQPAEGVSYAAKIKKQDGAINWRLPAHVLGNRIRAFTPWPGAFTHLTTPGRPLLLKLWEAEPLTRTGEPGEILAADKHGIIVAAGEGALRIHTLQREGGRRVSAAEFLAGCPLTPGQRLE